jgi:predicted enzyme related to lactoylglutathione lyase
MIRMPLAKSVSHIPYRAWDRAKSFDFFVDALGFYPQVRGGIVYAGLGDTLVEFMAADAGAESEAQGERYVLGLEVEDLDETLRLLEEKGAKVVKPIFTPRSFWGRQAVIDVPGGPQIALREYRSPDGPHFTDWHAEQ